VSAGGEGRFPAGRWAAGVGEGWWKRRRVARKCERAEAASGDSKHPRCARTSAIRGCAPRARSGSVSALALDRGFGPGCRGLRAPARHEDFEAVRPRRRK
jgi:hypothetical protein